MRRLESKVQLGRMFSGFLGNRSQRLQGMELRKVLPEEKQEKCHRTRLQEDNRTCSTSVAWQVFNPMLER